MPKTIFTLGSGRSGTTFLAEFFKYNIHNCKSNHETWWDFGNPSMFGKPVYYRCRGDVESLRPYFVKKAKRISNLKEGWYFEASHAFCKAMDLLAHEYFPDLYFIRSIRDPFGFARSAANREAAVHKMRFPFRTYVVDGQEFFFWALTGKESIFAPFKKLSAYQFYLLEWLEVEARAEAFLSRHDLHNRCFTLRCPGEFTADKFGELVAFFGLETKSESLYLDLNTNKTMMAPKTAINSQDIDEAREVFDNVPDEYINIYRKLFPSKDPIDLFPGPGLRRVELPEAVEAC